MLKYLRDAPLADVVLRVAGRPDIDAASLQAALRGVAAPAKRARSGPPSGTAAAILAAASRVARALPSRSSAPVLECIRLTIRDGVATMTATDLDLTLAESTPWESPDCGALMPGKLLLATLKAMAPDVRPVITQDGDVWRIGGATLRSAPLEDFPNAATDWRDAVSFVMTCEDIRRLFGPVLHCSSTEETRAYLRGAFFHVVGGEMRAVATDGLRLGRSVMAAPDGAERMLGVIVPAGTVKVLLATLPSSGAALIEVSETRVRVTCGALVLVSKVLDGGFPQYERVIPAQGPVTTYNNAELAAAVKAVRTVTLKKSAPILLTWPEGGGCEVSAMDAENGAASRVVMCDGARPAAPVKMSARHLLDILGEMGEAVWISFGCSDSPMLIGDESSLTYVLMPMRR